MIRRFRVPAANRAILADPPFDQIPELVRQNRKLLSRDDVRVGGLPLNEFRKQARAEVLGLFPSPTRGEGLGVKGSNDAPLLVTGHQPELSHPGVWVKNFALNGLARRLGGIPLHLIVDNDTMKSATITFPIWDEWKPESVRLKSAAYDEFDVEQPWETRGVRDSGQWNVFVQRVADAAKGWGYEPILCSPLPRGSGAAGELAGTWSHRFTTLRRRFEHHWGCDNRELPVSILSQTDSFRRFVRHIADDADCFRNAYNISVHQYRRTYSLRSRSHPVPDLAKHELPFWVVDSSRRRAATAADTGLLLRPRALTLTLFARLCLGDFFLHGIGGGKYDEVTDALLRDYFGIEPPRYQVLSATLHLPLKTFRSTHDDVHRLHRRRRDLDWNPERFIDLREAIGLKRRKSELLEHPPTGKAKRRAWFRELQEVKREIRQFVTAQISDTERKWAHARSEVMANSILRRRDYSWVLYPEEVLRPFLQGFL